MVVSRRSPASLSISVDWMVAISCRPRLLRTMSRPLDSGACCGRVHGERGTGWCQRVIFLDWSAPPGLWQARRRCCRLYHWSGACFAPSMLKRSKLTAPDFERLARIPCPIASSCGRDSSCRRCTRPRARATRRPLARADAALDGEPAARDRAAGQSGRRALCCRCPLSLSAEASNGTPAIGFGCIGKITTRAGIVRIADDLRMIWGCYCPHDDLRMLLSAYCLHPL